MLSTGIRSWCVPLQPCSPVNDRNLLFSELSSFDRWMEARPISWSRLLESLCQTSTTKGTLKDRWTHTHTLECEAATGQNVNAQNLILSPIKDIKMYGYFRSRTENVCTYLHIFSIYNVKKFENSLFAYLRKVSWSCCGRATKSKAQ